MGFRWLFLGYLFFLLMVAVAPIGSLTSEEMGSLSSTHLWSFRLDHLLHAGVFIPWMLLFCSAFRCSSARGIAMVLITGLMTAAAAEYIQMWMPHRTFTYPDLMANLTGVVIGSLVYILYQYVFQKAVS